MFYLSTKLRTAREWFGEHLSECSLKGPAPPGSRFQNAASESSKPILKLGFSRVGGPLPARLRLPNDPGKAKPRRCGGGRGF
jgi:hypothetical protein